MPFSCRMACNPADRKTPRSSDLCRPRQACLEFPFRTHPHRRADAWTDQTRWCCACLSVAVWLAIQQIGRPHALPIYAGPGKLVSNFLFGHTLIDEQMHGLTKHGGAAHAFQLPYGLQSSRSEDPTLFRSMPAPASLSRISFSDTPSSTSRCMD